MEINDKKTLKIAYAMFGEGSNIRFKKGPGDYVFQNISNNVDQIFPVGGEPENHRLYFIAKILFYRIFKKNFIRQRTELYLKTAAKKIENQLKDKEYDCVFSFGALQLAHLNIDKPMIFWSDTPFQGLLEFGHSYYRNITKKSLNDGHKADKWVLDRCKLAFYSSKWAADLAIKTYNIDPAKVKVMPLGANIDNCLSDEEINKLILKRIETKKCVNLLFAGNNWKFKGGLIACEIVAQLNKRGINSKLQVIGCNPIIDSKYSPYVEVFGVLDKNTVKGKDQFDKLFSEAHFFLLPTRAEAYGHVFCEANSFAVPALGTQTGGVTEIIKDNLNGMAFALDANIGEYCDFIQKYIDSDDEYYKLCLSSYNEYNTRFVWSKNCEQIVELIKENL